MYIYICIWNELNIYEKTGRADGYRDKGLIYLSRIRNESIIVSSKARFPKRSPLFQLSDKNCALILFLRACFMSVLPLPHVVILIIKLGRLWLCSFISSLTLPDLGQDILFSTLFCNTLFPSGCQTKFHAHATDNVIPSYIKICFSS
jgi:hypothetical protein